MLVFGAVDCAAALSRAGHFLGHRVAVRDACPVFATPARFPHADEVIVEWPHRYPADTEVDARTAVRVVTHDATFGIPLLRLALSLRVGYVGAMGSGRTHDHRLGALREAGVSEDELARLRSPIGLDLGARTPEETAVSITAEIVAHARQGTGTGTGLPLSRDGAHSPPRAGCSFSGRANSRVTTAPDGVSTAWPGVSRRCRRWTRAWWPRTRGSAEPRARDYRAPRSGR